MYRDGSSHFQKVFDYYSLGLVLLEIGTWNSLSNFYERYPKTYSPYALREEYIRFCEKELRMMMGPSYHEVTKACLQSELGFDKVNRGTDLDFHRVVQKLQSIRF